MWPGASFVLCAVLAAAAVLHKQSSSCTYLHWDWGWGVSVCVEPWEAS